MKTKLILESWRRFLKEGPQPSILFPDWLKSKIDSVHQKPGQGSIFAKTTDEIAKMVENIASGAADIDNIANTTGVLSEKIPGIGYDLVVPIVNGKPMHKGKELQGEITTVQKQERSGPVDVPAIITDEPMESFATDELTVIVRPMKDQDQNVLPGQYIILSAFPGSTGADKRITEWEGNYMVVIPRGA